MYVLFCSYQLDRKLFITPMFVALAFVVTLFTCNLYTCFVDLRKAFDTVRREALFQKLLRYGVCGKLFNIIKAMYSVVKYSVKLQSDLTDPFLSNIGVKQGCILSPLLFNIFC